jgi:phosphoglycolate phosphatase
MLILFDIDGTLLVRAADDHRDALHAALRRVYQVQHPETAKVSTAGRTDPWIARAILLQLGVSAGRIDERMSDFKHVAVEEYRRRRAIDLSGHVPPGMLDLLEDLRARDDVVLSLVTGNLQQIARLKLERAGLDGFFGRGQGGFGSDAEDRTELPAIARERAGRNGEPYPREDTVVVGDTPLDIACARADGVRVIAVTHGAFDAAALAEADAVVHSARELAAAL